jgi:ATP-binding cassette, subfamily B, bacterial
MTPPTHRNVWYYLIALIRFRPWTYLGLLVFVIMCPYLLAMIPPLLVSQVLNGLSDASPVGLNVWTLLAIMLVNLVVYVSTMIFGFFLEGSFSAQISTLLRRQMLARILQLPGAQALPASPGEAISRFRDDVFAVHFFLTYAPDVPMQLIVSGLALLMLATINVLFTVVAAVPLVATAIIVNAASKRIRQYRRSNQEAIGAVTGSLGEIFGAVQAIKIAGSERHVVNHFRGINDMRRKATLRELLFAQSLFSVTANIGNVCIGIVLLLASLQTENPLSVGEFSLFVSYLTLIAGYISFFGDIMARYRQVEVSMQRLTELMQGAPPEQLVQHESIHPEPEPPMPTLALSERLETLAVRGLTYRHPNSTHGIHGIDLTLTRGTITVITGRVGSGKSTLLKVLLGLLPKQSGEILWNGVTVDDPASFFVPPRTAYTAQVPRLFSETLRDNILMGLPEERLHDAIQLAVLEDDLTYFANGLDTRVGIRGTKVSGGQAQRTAAARMFARKPELLVFDDLSSALDVNTERILWERLFSQAETPTCLVVSYRQYVFQRADQIIVLKDGAINGCGTTAELLQSNREFQQLWEGKVEGEHS